MYTVTGLCDFLTWRDGKRLVALDKLLQYHHSTLLHTAKDPKKVHCEKNQSNSNMVSRI